MLKYENLSAEMEQKILNDRANGTFENLSFSDENAIRRNANRDKPSLIRPAFARDIDKIMHCPYYNRYADKTQVFSFYKNDDITRRALHVQLVSRTARTLGAVLGLNLDLIEAIALGHDLGHTPFGHAGERALNSVFPGGFRHYEQSLRVVERLEKSGKGLNLTYEVRDGIACHTRGKEADTLEGRIVKLADKIAYINHDIDDATRAGVMSEEDIPLAIRKELGFRKAARINTMVLDVVENSVDDIVFSDRVQQPFDELHAFMFDKVYTNPVCKGEETKAIDLILRLYDYFLNNPDRIPKAYHYIIESEGEGRAVCDYIAGMSDRYLIAVYKKIFIPDSWVDIGIEEG